MHGNVWEWCLDWYEENINAYGGKVNINPAAPAATLSGATSWYRVNRGGPWNWAAGSLRPASRATRNPQDRVDNGGFRVVCTAGLQ